MTLNPFSEERPRSLPRASRVVIAGGGPSGLFLALDLAHYGIPSIVLEPRASIDPHRPRAKTTNARTMTHLRRIGLAQALRDSAPLPVSYSQDVIFCTSLTGHEVTRFRNAFQLAANRYELQPECGQQVGQPVLEAVLREAAEREPLIDFRVGYAVVGLEIGVEEPGVPAHFLEIEDDGGARHRLRAEYIVGADGGSSPVRKALGIRLEGASAPRSNLSVLFRSKGLADAVRIDPAVQYWVLHPEAPGMIGPADLHGTWWAIFQGVDLSGAHADPTASVRAMVGADIDVEIIAEDPWTARMLLAERYRSGKVFLVGDAAHLNPPWGGHGFNTCIGDAANLAWKLAAVLHGWGSPALLDSYETERRPVAERTILDAAANGKALTNDFADDSLDRTGNAGSSAREAARKALEVKRSEFDSLGLVLGYAYPDSPLVTSDGTEPPANDPIVYVPTATPGSLLPHAWLPDGSSLYDLLGPGFTLLVDQDTPTAEGESLGELLLMSSGSPIPLDIRPVGTDDRGARFSETWKAPAVLVRPDQHVAWRGSDLRELAEAAAAAAGWPQALHADLPSPTRAQELA